MIGDALDWLKDVSGHPWFLLIIFAIAFLDSVIPIVPSETTVIIGGVAAGQGEQVLLLVIVVGALGAFLGDNTAYWIGRRAGGRVERRLRDRGRNRLDWAKRQLQFRGGMLLITGRFIPGGRTAITVSSGITRQPPKRFAMFVGIAAAIWASYAALLGFIGGKRFEDDHRTAFVFAFSLAVGVTILIEVVRFIRHRRKPAGEPAL